MSAVDEPLVLSVDQGRVTITAPRGLTRFQASQISATAPLRFAPPSGSHAAGWTMRSNLIVGISEVTECFRALQEAGYQVRIQPGGTGRSVLMLRVLDADAAAARMHWDIELEMQQMVGLEAPSLAADGDYMVVLGLVEPASSPGRDAA